MNFARERECKTKGSEGGWIQRDRNFDKNFDLDGFEEEREKKMEDRNEAPM